LRAQIPSGEIDQKTRDARLEDIRTALGSFKSSWRAWIDSVVWLVTAPFMQRQIVSHCSNGQQRFETGGVRPVR
jgi:hypothetical protein